LFVAKRIWWVILIIGLLTLLMGLCVLLASWLSADAGPEAAARRFGDHYACVELSEAAAEADGDLAETLRVKGQQQRRLEDLGVENERQDARFLLDGWQPLWEEPKPAAKGKAGPSKLQALKKLGGNKTLNVAGIPVGTVKLPRLEVPALRIPGLSQARRVKTVAQRDIQKRKAAEAKAAKEREAKEAKDGKDAKEPSPATDVKTGVGEPRQALASGRIFWSHKDGRLLSRPVLLLLEEGESGWPVIALLEGSSVALVGEDLLPVPLSSADGLSLMAPRGWPITMAAVARRGVGWQERMRISGPSDPPVDWPEQGEALPVQKAAVTLTLASLQPADLPQIGFAAWWERERERALLDSRYQILVDEPMEAEIGKGRRVLCELGDGQRLMAFVFPHKQSVQRLAYLATSAQFDNYVALLDEIAASLKLP